MHLVSTCCLPILFYISCLPLFTHCVYVFCLHLLFTSIIYTSCLHLVLKPRVSSVHEGSGPRQGDGERDAVQGAQAETGVHEGRQLGGQQGVLPPLHRCPSVFPERWLLQRLVRVLTCQHNQHHAALLREFSSDVTWHKMKLSAET